ncbi:MAG: monovalent cation/H(+) antiporter subunit G [Bryobacterales bacterium]|nr:monovalent cation/H(+) antiporter subunit G [Bryobacteraceae bacterium]MDW8356054.1 monovalent cation/H(+) antiporter subunit G [Bryobacterales bacterium]
MTEYLTAALLVAGAVFTFLSAVGVARMPDLYTRMQATTKATTLGLGLIVFAVAVNLGTPGVWLRAVAIVVFLYVTAPVAAHVIARAAYFVGNQPWKGTQRDELRGRYDPETHRLAGAPSGESQTPTSSE